ncbi:flagellar basal-body rod modification protein FlgD [Paenibacillus rhizosphaerae]|uniref:Basal-body rod modification protein FlgD n=1 Tax=Paenibacillus rhizosphaerae TaxID=297318 RepID=A0A839TGF3_9BACL|nr:flagellar hook capping FlgD N-terminal domain-containing protein [Paenibacillus rhizosphaerae]MBB3125885.1 flagellar basal-body rod modification protein FlgD [Paenibacillus rhizosphaerae]
MSDIVSTSNIWPNYAASNVQKASTKTQTLGKDQFLSILVTQLQNQDPMQPMEDKEFIAQMAQFTSVEQLMNISSQLTAMSQSLGNVSGLIGKQISWVDSGSSSDQSSESEPEIKTGIVDSIIVKDGVQYASVGSVAIPITKIVEIMDAKEEVNTPPTDAETPPPDGTSNEGGAAEGSAGTGSDTGETGAEASSAAAGEGTTGGNGETA